MTTRSLPSSEDAPRSDCVFCRIVKGEIPCHKVYEDKEYLGFLDITPRNPGHSLIVTKRHYRWVDDAPQFGSYFEAAKRVGLALKSAMGALSVSYLTLGNEVPHAHIWVVPRYRDDGHGGVIDWKLVKQIPPEEMKRIASLLSKGINTPV